MITDGKEADKPDEEVRSFLLLAFATKRNQAHQMVQRSNTNEPTDELILLLAPNGITLVEVSMQYGPRKALKFLATTHLEISSSDGWTLSEEFNRTTVPRWPCIQDHVPGQRSVGGGITARLVQVEAAPSEPLRDREAAIIVTDMCSRSLVGLRLRDSDQI